MNHLLGGDDQTQNADADADADAEEVCACLSRHGLLTNKACPRRVDRVERVERVGGPVLLPLNAQEGTEARGAPISAGVPIRFELYYRPRFGGWKTDSSTQLLQGKSIISKGKGPIVYQRCAQGSNVGRIQTASLLSTATCSDGTAQPNQDHNKKNGQPPVRPTSSPQAFSACASAERACTAMTWRSSAACRMLWA